MCGYLPSSSSNSFSISIVNMQEKVHKLLQKAVQREWIIIFINEVLCHSVNKILIAIPIIAVAVGIFVAISMSTELEPVMTEPESVVTESEPVMPASASLEGTVNIGLLFPLTGDLASQGEEDRIAAQLAVDDFNEYLEGKGSAWSINGIVEDSQTNPVIALDKVTAMHAKGAKMVIGPSTSANLRNLMGYTAANNMMMISYGSTAPSLAIPDDNVFRTVPDDDNQGPAIASLMASRGIDVLVPVWRGDTWGDGLKESTAMSFSEAGGIVDDGIRYNPEAPEFSASTSLLANQVQKYVDKYGEDRVGVLLIAFAEVLQFMQSASSHEVLDDVRWFGSDGSTNVQSLVDDSIGLEFAYATDFTTLQFVASENPKTDRVTELIKSELGRIPTVYAYCTYDAVWLAGLAMEAAQSTDTDAIKTNMIPVAENHTGAVGSTKLNAAGDLDSSDYAVWTIRDDQWMVIGSSSMPEMQAEP